MTSPVQTRRLALQLRLVAGGFGIVTLGGLLFLLTPKWQEADRLAWTWFAVATGAAMMLSGLLMSPRSRLARVILGIGIVLSLASIFVFRIVLNLGV